MGGQNSKDGDHSFDRGSTLSLSSKRRSTRIDEVQNVKETIQRIKDEIEFYTGTRSDPRYVECQKILADLSSKLQEMKKSGKRKSTTIIDDQLDDIKVCFRLLEEKVSSNEGDHHLDHLASVESHSFINQNVNKLDLVTKPEFHGSMDSMISSTGYHPKKEKPKYKPISTMDLLEQQTDNIEKEVNNAVKLEDTRQFMVLEKKIQILYTDLEMIQSDLHTPMHDRKEILEKRLIKYNNQLKKTKRTLERKSRTASQLNSISSISSVNAKEVSPVNGLVPNDLMDEIGKIGKELEEYELKVTVFDGLKADDGYKYLVEKLERYWSNVYNIEEFSKSDRLRKAGVIEKIKRMLKSLENKAELNEKIFLAESKLNKIEDDLKNLHYYQDNSLKDQILRSFWDELGKIETENDSVKERKNALISEIREKLKNISVDKNNIQEQEDNLVSRQILKQAEEFLNHWNQFEFNLKSSQLKNKEKVNDLLNILDSVSQSITAVVNSYKINLNDPKKSSSVDFNKSENVTLVQEKENENEPEDLENKSFISNNYVLDSRHYKKPDLISSEKDIQVAVEKESASSKIQTLSSTNTLSEIGRIRIEAKDLVNQVNTFNIFDEKEQLRLKNELKQLQDAIKNLEANGSQTISTHRSKAEEIINYGLTKLNDRIENEFKFNREQKVSKVVVTKFEQQRGNVSVSKSLQDIMEVDANVQYLYKQIQKFEGISKDPVYEKLESGLLENQKQLLAIDIQGHDSLKISKNEIFQQIGKFKKELEERLIHNQNKVKSLNPKFANIGREDFKKQSSHELKSVIEHVQKLKAQVERFSGIYKGIQYKQIEDGLKTALVQLDALEGKGNEKVESAKAQTVQKIEHYLKILEEKSMKVNRNSTIDSNGKTTDQINKVEVKNVTKQTPELNMNPAIVSYQQIESLRSKLVSIKDAVESFEGLYKDPNYVQLENELVSCKADLDAIQDHGHSSILTSKNQYIEYIEKLLQYFQEKLKVNEDNVDWDGNPVEELKNAEKELEVLRIEVEKFSKTDGEEVLKQLDERLTVVIDKINQINTGNLVNLRDLKNKMLLDVQKTVNLLHKKAQEMLQTAIPDDLQQIQNEIEYVSQGVNSFSGTRFDKKYVEYDEALIQMMMRVKSIDTRINPVVAETCVKAIQTIQETMKILQEKVKIPGLEDNAPIVHNLGTFV